MEEKPNQKLTGNSQGTGEKVSDVEPGGMVTPDGSVTSGDPYKEDTAPSDDVNSTRSHGIETGKIRRFKCKVCSFEFERMIQSNQNEQFIINEIHCDKPMRIVFVDRPEFAYDSNRLESLRIPKNRTAKLTLSIRQHQQQFLYDQMQTMNYEERLEFISNHLTSLQEANYEMRERELATAKVKELVLTEIDKLNKIDVEKYRRTGLIEESSIQKRERAKLEKDIKVFRGLNMSDAQIINILSPQGFSEEKIKEVLNAV